MVITDSNTKFVDKAGIDYAIEELKKLIEASQSGNIDLSDYVTREQLQEALDSLDINIDLSAYATKEELQQAIASIDLTGYATTEYVDSAIANIPSGGSGDVDLSNYYTKAETYNKEEVDNLIPSITDGKDGTTYIPAIGTVASVDSAESASASVTVDETTKTAIFNFSIPKGQKGDKGDRGQDGAQGAAGQNGTNGADGFSPVATVSKVGNTATITITDKNGTTTATVSDGADGAGDGSGGGSAEVYSTTETEVGTWIDGKAIYRRTFVVEGLVNDLNYYYFDTDGDIDEIVSINAVLKTASGVFYPMPICFYDIYCNLSSNSTTNIQNALRGKCTYIYAYKKNVATTNRFFIWLGNYGGTDKKIYATIEYTKAA